MKVLQEKEHSLSKVLDFQQKDCSSSEENVCSFQDLVLLKEKEKLHNKLAILKHMSPDHLDDEDDEPA